MDYSVYYITVCRNSIQYCTIFVYELRERERETINIYILTIKCVIIINLIIIDFVK